MKVCGIKDSIWSRLCIILCVCSTLESPTLHISYGRVFVFGLTVPLKQQISKFDFVVFFLEGCKHGRIHYWLHWGRHIPSNIFWLLLFFSGWLLQLVSPILNFPKPTIVNKYFGTVCIKHNCQLSKSPVTGQAIWERKQFQRRGIYHYHQMPNQTEKISGNACRTSGHGGKNSFVMDLMAHHSHGENHPAFPIKWKWMPWEL